MKKILVAVGVLAVVPQRRDFLLEILALNHIGIAPRPRGIQRLVGSLIMHQVDIMRRAVVDVMHLLHLLEDLMIVDGNIGDVGIRERRSTATDAAPGGTAAVVDHHRTLACL